jgi:type II secretory pathway predicted ATPase ExeA
MRGGAVHGGPPGTVIRSRRRTGALLALLGALGLVLAVERAVIPRGGPLVHPVLIGVGSGVVGAIGLLMLVWPNSPGPRARPRRLRTRPEPPREAPPPAATTTESFDVRQRPPDQSAADDRVTPAVGDWSADAVSTYWRLSEPAFDNSPNPKFFYRAPQHDEALARLLYAVEHRKGCAMLTGEYGCGKTMVSRALIGGLDPARYELALLVNPVFSVTEFLREILYQWGVETAATGKPELLREIQQVLLANLGADRSAVLMVDEAQLIEDSAVLEELRLLLNFQTSERFLMTLLLIGSVELAERLRPVPHLAQRIAVRARVGPLDLAETHAYVAHRLAVAGRHDRVFTERAIGRIFEGSRGRPRMINNLCELSLLRGYRGRLPAIDEDTVAASVGELEGSGDG